MALSADKVHVEGMAVFLEISDRFICSQMPDPFQAREERSERERQRKD
jgi:hypothetical protein